MPKLLKIALAAWASRRARAQALLKAIHSASAHGAADAASFETIAVAIAAGAGLSWRSIQRWRAGRATPQCSQLEALEKYAKTVGVDVETARDEGRKQPQGRRKPHA